MKKPFRKVVESKLCEGVVSIGGGFRGRWWELALECGHEEERPCRYQPGGERGWGRLWHGRPLSEVLDPPKKVRCYECSKTTAPS